MAGVTEQGVADGGQPPARPPASRRAGRTKTARPRRVDESMTLLREVMERPLDPGYATAAERRAAGAPPRGGLVTVVIAVVCGLVLTWSVVVLRAPKPDAVAARSLLVQQIEARTDGNDAAKARIERYRNEVRRAQSRALSSSGDSAAAAAATTLGIMSGDVAVTGPGLRVELDDAPGSRDPAGANSDPRGDSSTTDGRVFDRDLQTIVNGLWGAGAEAISVNDQRLTSLSAIRSAGEAILVDFRPLVPPYVIRAIGDPTRMQTEFAASAAGAYLQSLQDNFGVKADLRVDDSLTVRASGTLALRRATPEPTPSATSTSTPTPADPATPSTLPSAATKRSSSPEATP
jgi:uncharacterized protein YlxW (UPF0749 family)